MWLNSERLTDESIADFRASLSKSCPNHIVIDKLFNETMLDAVVKVLQQPDGWITQRHTYDALYVDDTLWKASPSDERFVQRDVWQREAIDSSHTSLDSHKFSIAQNFLSFLRGDEFMSILSRIFDVALTDLNVADPSVNTNFFRLASDDFVQQHADDSPGREVCMLLYLNKGWNQDAGGELVFIGADKGPVEVSPAYNRCVLFDPSSTGSEHWVARMNSEHASACRYNVTSWYWSE